MKVKLLITDETKWVAYGPCRVVQFFGNNNTGADVYLQYHEKPLVTAGDVPAVASNYCPSMAPFDFKFADPISLSELTLAVSSTNVNYTALTNAGVDATVIVETDFPVGSNTTLVGDLSTGVNSRAIWSEASGASAKKRLLRVDVKNNAAVTIQYFVSALDSTAPVNSTMAGPFEVVAGATGSRYFGRDGYRPLEIVDGVSKFGCTVYFSDDQTPPYGFPGSTDINVRGIYDI